MFGGFGFGAFIDLGKKGHRTNAPGNIAENLD
jgi:hypothetical protein